ncbi:HD-GYP domain-containing protein [Algicola sagamiensis]|uniref:HD-GYP domain-containing protein n=1 Tax=Algicola sagamiensis TaxID=163869 RepID=UPI0003748C08|nr:HD-GYP domain-containing protein [Algicola sagamiensis]
MIETLDVDQLEPGMFVNSVLKQKGRKKIKTKGWVRTAEAIESLKRSGILVVTVDTDKRLPGEDEQEEPEEEPIEEDEEDEMVDGKIPIKKELIRAEDIYREAKVLQRKALSCLKSDLPIDVGSFIDIGGNMVNSVFRNHDALSFMTRIRSKDEYLLEHSINVAILMAIFGKFLEMDKQTILSITIGALLHDIGKIKVPDEILNKPGKLTEEEFCEMKMHVVHGRNALLEHDVDELTLEVAAFHHEKLDGTGYPHALDADELSIYARMIAICDVYDALTGDRCYKDGMPPVAALKILRKDSGPHFDTDLVNKFINCMGVHPVGSLVKLKSDKIGLVMESNKAEPLRPIVKTFYSTKFYRYTEIRDINLADPKISDDIESPAKAEEYKIDLHRFVNTVLFSS